MASRTTLRANGWDRYAASEVRAALRKRGSASVAIRNRAMGTFGTISVSKGDALALLGGPYVGTRLISASITRDEHEQKMTTGRYDAEAGRQVYEEHTKTITTYTVVIDGTQPGL